MATFALSGALSCHVRNLATYLEKPNGEATWEGPMLRGDREKSWPGQLASLVYLSTQPFLISMAIVKGKTQ